MKGTNGPRSARTAPPEQQPREVSLDVEMTQIERELHDHLPEESRDIIVPVDSARRRALVREVPPAEEPAESAAKEHQCVRYHRSKEREESATRTTAEGG